MKRWLVGPLAAVAIGCGGDEGACEEANRVADQIREEAAKDGLTGAPCVEGSTDGLPPDRIADYERACARYKELKAKCDG